MKVRGKTVSHRNPALVVRDAEMVLMFRDGKSMQEIGNHYGISRERVRQRLNTLGLDAMDGGATFRTLSRAGERAKQNAEAVAKRERDAFNKYGMTPEQFAAISPLTKSDPKHPWMRYVYQRKSAAHRGIGWEISFADWWRIWQESGHWAERGNGRGYCMARWADDGPYSPENVYICTIGQNFSDSYITKPWAERFPDGGITKRRSGAKGWTFRKHLKSRPYAAQASANGKLKYLGSFATPEEASAVYQAFISNIQPGQGNAGSPAESSEASLPA